jgi:hypothetical protein
MMQQLVWIYIMLLTSSAHGFESRHVATDCSVQDLPRLKRTLLRGQYRVRALVCSSAFNNIYLVAILLNTVALAIVYDGMSAQ